MAIIYSYPNLPFNKLTGDDLFIVTDSDVVNDNPTRSLSLDNVVKYVKENVGVKFVERKLFTATSKDTTTDYNLTTETPIVWDEELIKDSIYMHDSANTPTQVTVTEAGTYRIYAMLTATSTGQRAQVLLRIAVNGTATGRLGAGMYIRNSSSHDQSSATIEETMKLSANDIITITGQRGAISTSTYNISQASYFSIEKIA